MVFFGQAWRWALIGWKYLATSTDRPDRLRSTVIIEIKDQIQVERYQVLMSMIQNHKA